MTRVPDTVAGVVARLGEIQRGLSPGDGVAVFNAMYLRVTEQVAAELEAGTTFADPEFMHELDVRFAGLWIGAYDAAVAGGKVPSAWAPLFEERNTRGIFPIQYALAGMNAHIEIAEVAVAAVAGIEEACDPGVMAESSDEEPAIARELVRPARSRGVAMAGRAGQGVDQDEGAGVAAIQTIRVPQPVTVVHQIWPKLTI